MIRNRQIKTKNCIYLDQLDLQKAGTQLAIILKWPCNNDCWTWRMLKLAMDQRNQLCIMFKLEGAKLQDFSITKRNTFEDNGRDHRSNSI